MTIKDDINTDLAELFTRLKLGSKEAEVFMVDFEKSWEGYSGLSGVIMDIGYNFVDIGAVIKDGSSGIKPASEFISESTMKILYETLASPVFYRELNNIARMRRKANQNVYGFHQLLRDHGWFTEEVTRTILDAEFANFLRGEIERQQVFLEERIKYASEKSNYWKASPGYKTGNPYNIRQHENRTTEYHAGKYSLLELKNLMKEDFELTNQIESGALSTNKEFQNVQRKYQLHLYNVQKNNNPVEGIQNSTAHLMDSDRNWAKDAPLIAEIGYGGKIEPWKKIMGDLEKKLDRRKDSLVAISAYNISAEKQNLRVTSELFGTPEYSNFIDRYNNICMYNMVGRLNNVSADDLFEFLTLKDPKAMEERLIDSFETSGTLGKRYTLQAYFRTELDANYKQKHTGYQDAYDQSELFVNLVRKKIVPFLEGR